MSRDSLRHFLLVLMILLAGCSGLSGEPTASQIDGTTPTTAPASTTVTSQPGGYIEATVVEQAPEKATVLSANKSSLRDIEAVQEIIHKVYPDGQVEKHLNTKEIQRVEDEMPQSALFEGDLFGWYLTYRNAVIRLRIIHYAG